MLNKHGSGRPNQSSVGMARLFAAFSAGAVTMLCKVLLLVHLLVHLLTL
jgi:hypothetical protein